MKTEHWTINDFKLWCWRRLLRVPWTARISNQTILKEINSEYSLEGLMLKLKLQYFGHLMQRTGSLEKNPDPGKDWGQQEKGETLDEMIRWHHGLNGHEFEEALGNSEGQGSLACCSPWSCSVGHDWVTEQQPTVSTKPSKCVFTKHFPFHFDVNCLPPHWNPKPQPSTSSLVSSWRWCLRWGVRSFSWAT